MSNYKNITIEKVKEYLKNNGCKIVEISKKYDNKGVESLYIYDLKKIQPIEHNKDLRLLNELGEHYVKVNYPLFTKDLKIDSLEVVEDIFGLTLPRGKFKAVKPFKKIVKKKLICSPNKRGQIIVKTNIIRRDIS